MIKIMVDEAYAFDMLAILQIKSSKSEEDAKNYIDFLTQLAVQLGDIAVVVLGSEEYADMVDVNQKVFNLVDEVVEDAIHNASEVLAIDVHRANMKRFTAKKALQEKFFSNNLTERKTVE